MMLATACAFSSRSPVTMTMRRMPSWRRRRIVRAASARIGSSRSSAPTGTPSTSTKIVRALSRLARRRTLLAQLDFTPAVVQLALPTATLWPSTIPRTPWPGTSSTVVGEVQRHLAGSRRSDDRRREDMRRDLVEACGVAQHVVGAHLPSDHDVRETWPTGRDRAGLVEQQHFAVSEPLQSAAALHNHTPMRGS